MRDAIVAPCRIHHFDNQGNTEKPWLPCPEICYGQPCWCANVRDRLSASILNARLPKSGGQIPNYSQVNVNAAAGLVLNPAFTRVLCAYPYDGGTAGRTCDPVGVSQSCVPGCFQFDREGGGPGWCDEDNRGSSCAFKPNKMADMMESQRNVPWSGGVSTYNEVVIDMEQWLAWLPQSIEAVWFLKSGNCYAGGSMLCEQFARRVHAQLLQQYGVTDKDLPLLTLDVFNWDKPFAMAWAA